MKFKMKHQGNVLYLLGYLIYISSQAGTAKAYFWLIGLALTLYAASLLIPLLQRQGKNSKIGRRLVALFESGGGLLTLFFALTYIPKARYIETHLALFGLLILTFLAARNILPGLTEEPVEAPDDGVDHSSAMGMSANKF